MIDDVPCPRLIKFAHFSPVVIERSSRESIPLDSVYCGARSTLRKATRKNLGLGLQLEDQNRWTDGWQQNWKVTRCKEVLIHPESLKKAEPV